MKNLLGFETDMRKCPLDTPVYLYGEYMMFHCIYKGTLTLHNGEVIRGECLKGDEDMFYRSTILGWKEIL